MYITFDYKCRDYKRCEHFETRMIKKDEMDDQRCGWKGCQALMTRLPANTRTTFRFADRKLKR